MNSKHSRNHFRHVAVPVLGIFLATTVLATFPGHVYAQQDNRLRVYVFPMTKGPDVSRIISVKIEEFFSAILSVSDKIKVMREEDLIIRAEAGGPTAGPAPNAGLEQADKLVWQGKEEIEKKSFKDAVQTFRSAIELYQQNFAELVDYDKLVDAYLSMAVAYFGAGYDDNGTDALRQVVSLRPTVTVDRKQHTKSFLESLEKVQKKFSAYKSGKTTFTTTPTGGKVFVDGILRGTAPVTVSDLQKGDHYVQVRLDGFKTYAEQIRAPVGTDTLNVSAKLEAGGAPAAAQNIEGEFVSPESLKQYAESGNFGENFKRAAARFTQRANVDFLIYEYLSTTTDGYLLHIFLYDNEKNAIAALEPVKFDRELTSLQVNLLESEQVLIRGMAAFPMSRVVSDPPPAVYREAQQKIVAAQTQPTQPIQPVTQPVDTGPVLAPVRQQPTVTQAAGVKSILGDYPLAAGNTGTPGVIGGIDSDEQWYEKWWVWTLVGVGVAGAGVGIAAGAGAFSSDAPAGPTTFTGTVTVP